MLKIPIKARESVELWDEKIEEFVLTKSIKAQTLELEHSLMSISKWEAKWHKPFLVNQEKTSEEMADYIKCMTLTSNVDPYVYTTLTKEDYERIGEYINDPMTATTLSNKKGGKGNRETKTSEVLYCDMISLQIPFECQKWHLNRLIMLINVCSAKNEPPKKTSMRDRVSKYSAINAANKKRLNTRG